MDIAQIMNNLKNQKPLIHNITNYVTANDVANILLAADASCIMADEVEEVEEITSICDGLNINIGTIHTHKIDALFKAGIKANQLHHPITLDPVGIGASSLRRKTIKSLLENIHFDVIKGNISEIKAIANHTLTHGVDALQLDMITQDNLNEVIEFAKKTALSTNSIIAISSAIDIICDGQKAFVIYNGHPMMSRITGSGCMLSALICAYITANLDHKLEACACAFLHMDIAGEKAYQKMVDDHVGTSSYRTYLIDYISLLQADDIIKGAKYEIR